MEFVVKLGGAVYELHGWIPPGSTPSEAKPDDRAANADRGHVAAAAPVPVETKRVTVPKAARAARRADRTAKSR